MDPEKPFKDKRATQIGVKFIYLFFALSHDFYILGVSFEGMRFLFSMHGLSFPVLKNYFVCSTLKFCDELYELG